VTSAASLASNQLVLGAGGQGSATLGTTGSATTVLHGGAGAPSFSAVNLTSDVTGVLPIANGGTGNALGVATNVSGIVAAGNGGTGVDSHNTAANLVFAGPASGSAAAPTFRTLTSADLPPTHVNRTICYIAGSDSSTAQALAVNDSIGAYFINTIGAMTANSLTCITNTPAAGNNQVTLQLVDFLPLGNQFSCTNAGNTYTFLTITGNPTTTIGLNDILGLQVGTGGTATRATVCIAASVN
jgi:hypothetical protein